MTKSIIPSFSSIQCYITENRLLSKASYLALIFLVPDRNDIIFDKIRARKEEVAKLFVQTCFRSQNVRVHTEDSLWSVEKTSWQEMNPTCCHQDIIST